MKYKAVVFDLFGTLTEEMPPEEEEKALAQIAAAIRLPQERFVSLWIETWPLRGTGDLTTLLCLEHICRALGAIPKRQFVSDGGDQALSLYRRALRLRSDAIETLSLLKSYGCKIGIISNAPPEIPSLWSETPLASLVNCALFSCSVGILKPDPRIYRLLCERLAVKPEVCLYVGDGGDHELTGATQVGMQSVLLSAPNRSTSRYYFREDWPGLRVSSLNEVLPLVDGTH